MELPRGKEVSSLVLISGALKAPDLFPGSNIHLPIAVRSAAVGFPASTMSAVITDVSTKFKTRGPRDIFNEYKP